MKLFNKSEDPFLDTEPAFQMEHPKKFKELDFQGKLNFIWDYYKWWILGFIIFVTIAVYTIPGVIENHKEPVLYTAFLNTQITNQDTTDIMDDFVKEAKIPMDGKRIVLDTSLIINRDRADEFSMQCNQKLLALFSANTLDVLLCDDENFQFYAANGCFQSLEAILPKETFEKYKPYMLTCDTDKSEKTIYYGISVKTSKVLSDEHAYIVDPIFTICTNAKQPENAIKFLEFLMKEEINSSDSK